MLSDSNEDPWSTKPQESLECFKGTVPVHLSDIMACQWFELIGTFVTPYRGKGNACQQDAQVRAIAAANEE